MTNSPDTCPAAQIGKRIAEVDPKLSEYELAAGDAKGCPNFGKIVYDNALDDSHDEHNNLTWALSHVKATSQDGAAVQVAAINELMHKLMDAEDDFRREQVQRAIRRLCHSAISVLLDRQEADICEYGVHALAPSYHNPWTAPEVRIKAMQAEPALQPTKSAEKAEA